MRISYVLVNAALALYSYASLLPNGLLQRRNLDARSQDPAEVIWQKLNGSQSLEWHDCYPGQGPQFECARFLVPLDYSKPISSNNTASIAIIRTPSPYSSPSKEYKGPILLNPGGPGESGVDFVVTGGNFLRSILGNAFDIVGFDPRGMCPFNASYVLLTRLLIGVSRSLPVVSFFKNNVDRDLWNAQTSPFSVVNTSTNSIPEYVASAQVVGQLAEATNTDGYLQFINTDYTARDMLRITKAHGRDKIQYWGFSYGSVLGATFASMFPDNIDRLIIDGVVDAENYFATLWNRNLFDTDKVLDAFFESCFKAGPSKCAFYAPSPAAILQNLTTIYESLKSRPVPAFSHRTGSYGVIDYNFLRITLFSSFLAPYALFPSVADALAAISRGDIGTAWDIAAPVEQSIVGQLPDAFTGIACNDGRPIPGTIEDTMVWYEKFLKTSEWADVSARTRITCSGWPKPSIDIFRGPFVGNTSHPMLLIGNTADPVTPLIGAKKMAEGFPGSVVLTQDSVGHTSISGPSPCTMKYVRAYFENGTLPDVGTVCPVLGPPFLIQPTQTPSKRSDAQVLSGLHPTEEEDNTLIDAVVELSKKRYIPMPF
ncbi:hypothetical protein APHAL10511_008678 [Amanita phalloides]|nr:hypothetical protein APHAL10511_008678 [Amanita phalloides]